MLVIERTENSSFYVGDQEVVVTNIFSPSRFKVCVKGAGSQLDSVFEIRNTMQTEIMPKVFLQAGADEEYGRDYAVKVCVDAPRHITILRDTLYERARNQPRDR